MNDLFQHRISRKGKKRRSVGMIRLYVEKRNLNGNERIGLNVISAPFTKQTRTCTCYRTTHRENENKNDEYAHENSFGGQVGLRSLRN